MTNTDYDNMSISSEKKDEELEGFVKGKREELKKMIPDFGDKELARIVLNFYERGIRDGICFGMSKQKEQMIKKTVTCGGDGWFINCKRNGRKNGKFHKYYQSTITHDKPLMMDGGTKYKLIIIKEE